MKTYAIIETNTGFVWGVVESDYALQACYDVDMQAGGVHEEPGEYQEVQPHDAWTVKPRSMYDVRLAPEGFDVLDGQDPEQIAAVEALPRVGLYAWVPA